MLVKAETHPKPATYTVAFNSNGGSAVPRQRIKKGDKATEPADPTKQYYTFEEWDKNGVEYDFDTPVTSNFTLTAKWAEIEGALILVNRGSASLSYTATPVEGEAETGTIAAGGVATLAQASILGQTVSTIYSSIVTQYEGDTARTQDVSFVVENVEVAYEITNWDESDYMLTLQNATGETVTVTYKGVGDDSDTTQTIAAKGAFDMPDGIAGAISAVYTKIEAAWGDSETWSVDTTEVLTDDTVKFITSDPGYEFVDNTPSEPGASGGSVRD